MGAGVYVVRQEYYPPHASGVEGGSGEVLVVRQEYFTPQGVEVAVPPPSYRL